MNGVWRDDSIITDMEVASFICTVLNKSSVLIMFRVEALFQKTMKEAEDC